MTDAWEIIGRLLTDNKFEVAVFGESYSASYPVDTTVRADIPTTDYTLLRNAVKQKVRGPISLMALGELLIAMKVPNFRVKLNELTKAIADTGIDTSNREPMFYQALGATMVDQKLMAKIVGHFADNGFQLASGEDDLATIVNDNKVIAAATAFCLTCWARGCNLKTVPWDGHLHPIENPFRFSI